MLKSNTRSLCMVLASQPVTSLMHFVGRPMGIASMILVVTLPKMLSMARMMVVFPVSGSPVMTDTVLLHMS